MDAIRDEATRQVLAERLRMTTAEVAAQGELSELQNALTEAREDNERVEFRVSELMTAGREVTDSRDSWISEFRSARTQHQTDLLQQSELQRQQAQNLGVSTEEVSTLKERLARMNVELTRAHEVDSARGRRLACEE
eukprot:2358133-Amphidinium_carterae.1